HALGRRPVLPRQESARRGALFPLLALLERLEVDEHGVARAQPRPAVGLALELRLGCPLPPRRLLRRRLRRARRRRRLLRFFGQRLAQQLALRGREPHQHFRLLRRDLDGSRVRPGRQDDGEQCAQAYAARHVGSVVIVMVTTIRYYRRPLRTNNQAEWGLSARSRRKARL